MVVDVVICWKQIIWEYSATFCLPASLVCSVG